MDICFDCNYCKEGLHREINCSHDSSVSNIDGDRLSCSEVRGPHYRCYLLEHGAPWIYRERLGDGDDRYQIHHCDSPVCPTCDEQAHRMNEAKVKLAEIEVIENSIGFISECSLEDHE